MFQHFAPAIIYLKAIDQEFMAVSAYYLPHAFQADEMEKSLSCEKPGRNVDNMNGIFVKTADDMNLAAEASVGLRNLPRAYTAWRKRRTANEL